MIDHAKEIETKMSIAMDFQHAGSEAANVTTEFFRQRMREHIKDERLLRGIAASIGNFLVLLYVAVANEA